MQTWRDIIFSVDSFLGSGGFATVHKGIYKHMPVAVKVGLGMSALRVRAGGCWLVRYVALLNEAG
jgi:hypothetical protein